MNTIGVIPARYNSSRFPGKPLADICGKPMVWWVYHQCRMVTELHDLVVATDDDRVYRVCKKNDMNVMMTSTKHKTGTDRVAEVAEHMAGDLYINIQGDEPLIEPEEVRQVISIFKDEEVDCGTLKQKLDNIDEIEAVTNVKIVTDKYGNVLYMSRNVIPSNVKENKGIPIYKHIGIYGFRKQFLNSFSQLLPSALEIGEGVELLRAIENGFKVKAIETTYHSIGVDLPEHIQIVNNIIKERMKSHASY